MGNRVPSEPNSRETLAIPLNILLVDPEFHKPAKVQMLLGSGPTLSLFSIGQMNLSSKGADLFLQKTRLGWVIGGTLRSDFKSKKIIVQYFKFGKFID